MCKPDLLIAVTACLIQVLGHNHALQIAYIISMVFKIRLISEGKAKCRLAQIACINYTRSDSLLLFTRGQFDVQVEVQVEEQVSAAPPLSA